MAGDKIAEFALPSAAEAWRLEGWSRERRARRARRYGSGDVVVIVWHLHCPISASAAVRALPLIAYTHVRESVKTALRNPNDPVRELI